MLQFEPLCDVECYRRKVVRGVDLCNAVRGPALQQCENRQYEKETNLDWPVREPALRNGFLFFNFPPKAWTPG